jgi:hypothetical protein
VKILETEIQINASPENVWSILTNLEKYGEWNPFIIKANGKVKKGERLEVCISPPDGKEMTFKPTVKSAIENSEFSWLGRFLLPGIFDGRHIFTITKNDEGCLLLQKEEFSGALVPLIWGSMEKKTREGFDLMNIALKQRAESART